MDKDKQLSHDRVQQECWMYLWNTYSQTRRTLWHTPNEQRPIKGESHTSFMRRISQAKAAGVLEGVWDLVWYWKGTLHIFDVKLDGDYIKPAQKQFRDAIVAQGGAWYEINNVDQFKKIVDGIITSA